MDQKQKPRTFIVRFRWMQNGSQPTWIVSLQNIHTGQQMCFPAVDGLVRFLRDEFPGNVELKSSTTEYENEPVQINGVG